MVWRLRIIYVYKLLSVVMDSYQKDRCYRLFSHDLCNNSPEVTFDVGNVEETLGELLNASFLEKCRDR